MDAPFRPPLRGREQELAIVRRRLAQVRAGTGFVVMVEGSAGLGKTRLLDECVSMAEELSFRVGRGAAEPGRVIERGALFDALFEGDPPLANRRALNDVHASSEFLFWLLQDVQSLIEEAAFKSPLLICLDDLHWGGTSLSLAMRQLPVRLSSLPVAWVMAFRPEQRLYQVQQAKIELIESGAELIRLEPLNREAVAQLATDVERSRSLSQEPRKRLWPPITQTRAGSCAPWSPRKACSSSHSRTSPSLSPNRMR